jgi:hypothetical protein
MTTIQYKYEPPRPVLANSKEAQETYKVVKIAGGYNPTKNTFTPLKLDDNDSSCGGAGRAEVAGYAIFETIAAAMEAGIVDAEMWPTQLFSNQESYAEFIQLLSEYEVCFKLRDPWWSALRVLASNGDEDEEGYCTAAELAARFEEVLDDLPEQWC